MPERVDLTGVQSTMLTTLYLRALDFRAEDSILADAAAAAAVDRIDFDFAGQLGRAAASNRFSVATRARQLDRWTGDFLRRHPEATVLQLGCGLDSRAWRIELPQTARWFDVDLPDVIEFRDRLYEQRARVRTISASVTEPGWFDDVPAGPPTVVVAEGLLMYLAPDQVELLLRRITDRFGSGELLFDAAAPWVVRVTRLIAPLLERRGFPAYSWALADGREIERGNPRLRLREEVAVLQQAGQVGSRRHRAAYGVLNAVRPVRDALRLFRFEF
jgi:O-methyltransferase involved in polyketide biosynthesis